MARCASTSSTTIGINSWHTILNCTLHNRQAIFNIHFMLFSIEFNVSNFWHVNFIFMDVYKTTVKYKNLRIDYEVKSFRLKDVFKISRSSKSNISTIKVSIKSKKNRRIGECIPYKRYGDSLGQILKILK